MIKVMIAEDNKELCENCLEFLTNDNDIKVVSCVLDGEKALEKYFEIQPDVLLLDLNLPKISGLDVINTLSRFQEEKEKCNIVVVSGSIDLMHQLYNTVKIFRVIPKPADFEYLLETIKEIPIKNIENEINQKELKELLLELNLNIYKPNVKYLISAINIAYKQPYLLSNIKDLYSEVAKEYELSSKTIKWGIRTSIDTLNRSMTIDDFCSIFSIKIKPDSITPKYFITFIVEHFKERDK